MESDAERCFAIRDLGENKGKGVVALRDIAKDAVVLAEEPFVCVQHVHDLNHKRYPACDYCLRYVDQSLKDSLLHLDLEDVLELVTSNPKIRGLFNVRSASVCCPNGCGTKYCSSSCREKAEREYHLVLCNASSVDEFKKLSLSLEHACRMCRNSNPKLVVRFLSRLIQSYRSNSCSGMSRTEAFETAKKPFDDLIHHASALKDNLGKDDELRDLMTLQHQTIRELFKAYREDDDIASLLTFDAYLQFTSCLNVNQQFVNPESPFEVFWNKLDMFPEEEKDRMFSLLDPLLGRLNELGIEKISSVEGGAIYPTQHWINHSCAPNVGMRFLTNTNKLSVCAKRDIQKGEELCFDYIGFQNDFTSRAHRRSVLRSSYFFDCSCSKCS